MAKKPSIYVECWFPAMAAVVVAITTILLAAGEAKARDTDYPDTEEINQFLAKTVANHPHWTRLERVGQSYLGRDINMISIGIEAAEGQKQGIPILVNSAHHGDEKISVQVVLGLIEFMTESYGHPGVQALLKDYRFYLIPLVNPDGYAKNSRFNAQGIDINRDYHDRSSNSRFQSPEARYLHDLMNRLPLAGAVALHSGAEAVYWPLGESPRPAKDHDSLRKMAVSMGQSMGVRRVMQSYFDYPTQGEFIDYAYKRFGVLGVTLEVSYHHQPPRRDIQNIVYRSIRGLLAYAKALAEHRKGGGSPFQLEDRTLVD